MLGLFDRKRREARRLNRDAVSVIEMSRHAVPPERFRAIAERVASTLAEAHVRGGPDPARYSPLVDHFRTLHREARRRHDDTELTAYTLVIIYLRAEMVGEDAAPAREAIDAFVAPPGDEPPPPGDSGLVA